MLKDLDLSLERGEMVAIVGASGVGKSTLLHVLGGLDAPDAGSVRIDQVELGRCRTRRWSRSATSTSGSSSSSITCCRSSRAVENAEMPLRIARKPAAECRERAAGLLERVGLAERLEHRPGMLSGGEQQRVAIARALVMQPTLLLADEPTGDLDEHTADNLHELLQGDAPRARPHLGHRDAQPEARRRVRPRVAPRRGQAERSLTCRETTEHLDRHQVGTARRLLACGARRQRRPRLRHDRDRR